MLHFFVFLVAFLKVWQSFLLNRAEFSYIRDLIESRTIGSAQQKPAGTSKEASYAEEEKINDSTRFHGKFSTPNQSLPIPEEEVASPAEIAKAYMGSRPSKLSPSSLNLQRHVFREETTSLASSTPYTTRSSDVSVWPRSVVRFSKVPEQHGNGYFTPRPRGRSAIYKMSRSPYFKVPAKAETKGDMLGGDSYAGPSAPSRWAATNSILASKQILKKTNSVLESDQGSFGPIRRIRQKSNLVRPLKGICTPSRNLLPSSSTPIGVDNLSGFTSIQKPLQFNARRYGLGSEDAKPSDNRILGENDRHIPSQSFETAQKILQKLDKIVSSPKEKSSDLKAISMDGSPSKLTLGMLQGQALRSIEGIDSSNFTNRSRNFTVDDTHDSLPQSMPQKQDVLKNGPLELGVSQVKLPPASAVNVHAIKPATNAKSDSERTSGSVISGFAAVPLQEKTAFNISTVEGSLEMDDDCNVLSGRDKELKTGFKDTISNTQISDERFLSTCLSMPVFTTKSFGLFESKTSDAPVGFSFPAMPSSSSSFDSKAAPPETIFSSKSSYTVDVKSSTELSISNTLTATQLEDSDLFRDKIRKAGELLEFNTFGSPASPDFSSLAGSSIFAFGAPANSGVNNSCLNPKPSANFGSNASGSGNQIVSIFSTDNAIATSSFVSSTVPMFSTVETFQMVASGTACAPSSVSAPYGFSGFKDLKAKSTKILPFSFTSASSIGTSAISNPGIKDSSLSTSSSIPGTSSSLAVPASFASSVSGSSLTNTFKATASASFTSATPSAFSSTFGSHATSSLVFSSTGTGNFGFSFPAHSSGSSMSFASNSSQSSNQFGVPANSAFGAQENSSSTPSLTSSSSHGFGSSLFVQPATSLSSSSSQSVSSIFGAPAAGNLQFAFGSSSGPAFSFTKSTSSTPVQSTFGSGFPLNNQTNTEDNMVDDLLQSTAPTLPSFGQPSFPVGSAAIPSLGIQQPIVQFSQPTGKIDLGGSFSLGTTGDDKAHRRFVRVKRGKTGKK